MNIHCPMCDKFVQVDATITGFSITERGFEPDGTYQAPPAPWGKNQDGSWSCCEEHKK